MPSIQKQKEGLMEILNGVLNLIITGMPSILV